MTDGREVPREPRDPSGDPPFVGRAAELAAILSSVRAAQIGSGRLVLVCGPAGIGKSRLVREVMACVGTGVAVGVGESPPDLAVPALWPVRRALSGLLRARCGTDEVSALIVTALEATAPSAAPRPTGDTSPSWERLVGLEELVDRLLDVSRAMPLLLLLEDLQWADAETLMLLRLLTPALERHHLVVIATVRGRMEGGPLAHLTRSSDTDAYTLGPLAPSDVADYLVALGCPAVAAAEVHRLSGGLPLLVGVAADTVVGATTSEGADGRAPRDLGLPALVDRLVDPLDAAALATLTAGTVIGGDLDLVLLAVAADVDEHAARRAVVAGLSAGLLVTGRDGGHRFSHDLVRITLHDRAIPGDIQAAHRRLGGHLAVARGTPVAVAGHLARAAESAEDHLEVSRWWTRAALAADAALALDEAAAHRRSAVDASELAAAGPADVARALLDLADAEHRAGRHSEAITAGERASLLAGSVGRVDLVAAAALVAPWISYPAATDSLTRLCRAALSQEADLDLATRSRLRSKLLSLSVDRASTQGEQVAAQAMELAVASADAEALLEAAGATINVLPECDVLGRRLGLADLAVAEASRLERPVGVVIALGWRLRAAVELARPDLVEESLERLVRTANDSGMPLARWHALRARVAIALLQGDFDVVADLNERASAIALRSGDEVAVGMSHASARHLDELRGVSGPDLDETLALMAGAPSTPLLETMRGLELLRAGRRDQAEAAYRRVIPLVGTSPTTRPWMPVVQQLVTLAEAYDDREVAPRLVTELLAGAGLAGGAGISTAYFTGSLNRDLGRALVLAGRPREAETALRRAIEANTRIGARPDLALSRLDLAHVLASSTDEGVTGREVEALDLAAGAAAELRRLDMPGPLRRAQLLGADVRGRLAVPDLLSAREHEVVALLVTGLTNREIADRLVLSERTIESHVRSALMKRGCRNRAELIRAESSAGAPPVGPELRGNIG